MAKQKYRNNKGSKNKNQDEELLVDIVDAQEQALDFFERHQKYILGGLLAFVVVVGGWFAYSNLYKAPLEKEATEQLYKAEYMFRLDSLDLALNDPGDGYPGFLKIISDYGGTKAANLAQYYAGAIYLHKGEYQKAIDYLNDFSSDGKITPATSNGMIGDAYAELGKFSDALSYYKKASNSANDEFSKPYFLFKTGLLLKKEGKGSEAQEYFEQIKKDYPYSIQGAEIDKYISKG